MSKSIKLKDNTYIDSTGVTHSRTLLSTILDKIFNKSVGSTDRPTYFSSGEPKQCNTPQSGNWFRGVPFISSGGVMEVGRYIDFHPTNANTSDFTKRIDAGTGTTARTISIPDVSGTMAVKTSIADASNGWKKVDFGAFKIYFFYKTEKKNYGANSWSSWDYSLPVTYNKDKMAFSSACQVADNVIRLQCGTWDGSTVMRISWDNRYGGSLNNYDTNINAILIDFS